MKEEEQLKNQKKYFWDNFLGGLGCWILIILAIMGTFLLIGAIDSAFPSKPSSQNQEYDIDEPYEDEPSQCYPGAVGCW